MNAVDLGRAAKRHFSRKDAKNAKSENELAELNHREHGAHRGPGQYGWFSL
jgi:hypothetical protein